MLDFILCVYENIGLVVLGCCCFLICSLLDLDFLWKQDSVFFDSMFAYYREFRPYSDGRVKLPGSSLTGALE